MHRAFVPSFKRNDVRTFSGDFGPTGGTLRVHSEAGTVPDYTLTLGEGVVEASSLFFDNISTSVQGHSYTGKFRLQLNGPSTNPTPYFIVFRDASTMKEIADLQRGRPSRSETSACSSAYEAAIVKWPSMATDKEGLCASLGGCRWDGDASACVAAANWVQ